MLRSIKRVYPLVSISIFSKVHENDYDYLNNPAPTTPTRGWDRVKTMYSLDEYDELSIEIRNVMQTTMSSAFLGACLGGFFYSRNAYLNFIENNQASIFKSTADAKRKLQDYVTIAFAKGAVRWGWRISMFTAIFSLSATTVSVYRGDTSVVDYISAGAIAGGLYKMNLGLVPTFVGAGLGATLGCIFGGIIVLLLKLTGFKMEDVRKAMLKFKEGRKEQLNQAFEKASVIKHDALTDHHDQIVQERGVRKLEEIN